MRHNFVYRLKKDAFIWSISFKHDENRQLTKIEYVMYAISKWSTLLWTCWKIIEASYKANYLRIHKWHSNINEPIGSWSIDQNNFFPPKDIQNILVAFHIHIHFSVSFLIHTLTPLSNHFLQQQLLSKIFRFSNGRWVDPLFHSQDKLLRIVTPLPFDPFGEQAFACSRCNITGGVWEFRGLIEISNPFTR